MLKDMGEEDDDYYDDDINEVDEFWKKKTYSM